jgi:hypothetical protein
MAEVTTMKADLYSWQTREERKRLAEQLYGEGWTMQRIAEALSCSQPTIARDLAQFVPAAQTPRPKGGRPKESGNKPAPLVNKPAPVAVVEPVQQTKPAERQEDDLPNLPKEWEQVIVGLSAEVERYKALARFYKACASFESVRGAGLEGMLLGAAERQGGSASKFAKQLEQRLSEGQLIAEEAAEVEAAYYG